MAKRKKEWPISWPRGSANQGWGGCLVLLAWEFLLIRIKKCTNRAFCRKTLSVNHALCGVGRPVMRVIGSKLLTRVSLCPVMPDCLYSIYANSRLQKGSTPKSMQRALGCQVCFSRGRQLRLFAV